MSELPKSRLAGFLREHPALGSVAHLDRQRVDIHPIEGIHSISFQAD